MSVATFISRILGYVRDMIVAGFYGATGSADAFYVAFRIPNLLRELFAEGSASSAVIPVLTEYQTRQGEAEANSLVRSVFLFIIIFVGLLVSIGVVFAPAIVSAIAPGFLKDPHKFSQAVMLTRIMFPFLLFVSLAALTMGALNTRQVFFIPAFAPATLNVITIVCVLVLARHIADPIVAVAIGIASGGLAQFVFQLPAFFRAGYSFRRPKPEDGSLQPERGSFWHPGLKRIGLLVIPATVGLTVSQFNIFVSTILASYLPEGSITYLYYSMRLIHFPIGIFGVAMGMAVLPALSQHAVRGDFDKLKEDFSFALRLLFFITVPAMAGLIALRVPIVATLFQRGKFGHEAVAGTSGALLFYSLGIWAIVGVRVIAATFYSMQDTRTPVKIAAVAMLVNILLSIALMGPMRQNGLALSNAVASSVNFVLLFYFLRKRLGGIGARRIALSFIKTLSASVVMGFAGWFLACRSELWISGGHSLSKAFFLGATMAVCSVVFAASAYFMKSEELGYIIDKIKGRKLRVKS